MTQEFTMKDSEMVSLLYRNNECDGVKVKWEVDDLNPRDGEDVHDLKIYVIAGTLNGNRSWVVECLIEQITKHIHSITINEVDSSTRSDRANWVLAFKDHIGDKTYLSYGEYMNIEDASTALIRLHVQLVNALELVKSGVIERQEQFQNEGKISDPFSQVTERFEKEMSKIKKDIKAIKELVDGLQVHKADKKDDTLIGQFRRFIAFKRELASYKKEQKFKDGIVTIYELGDGCGETAGGKQ